MGVALAKEAGHFHRVSVIISSADTALSQMKINQLIFSVLGGLCLASQAPSCQIEQQDLNAIKPGITTEIDLIRRFGAPDTCLADTRGSRLLHWNKLGTPPPRGYLPIIGPWLGVLDVSWLDLSVQVRANGRVDNYMYKFHQRCRGRGDLRCPDQLEDSSCPYPAERR